MPGTTTPASDASPRTRQRLRIKVWYAFAFTKFDPDKPDDDQQVMPTYACGERRTSKEITAFRDAHVAQGCAVIITRIAECH